MVSILHRDCNSIVYVVVYVVGIWLLTIIYLFIYCQPTTARKLCSRHQLPSTATPRVYPSPRSFRSRWYKCALVAKQRKNWAHIIIISFFQLQIVPQSFHSRWYKCALVGGKKNCKLLLFLSITCVRLLPITVEFPRQVIRMCWLQKKKLYCFLITCLKLVPINVEFPLHVIPMEIYQIFFYQVSAPCDTNGEVSMSNLMDVNGRNNLRIFVLATRVPIPKNFPL